MKKTLLAVVVSLAATSAFATDWVEKIDEQITFAGKAGDTKVFSADAETMLELALRFPKELAELRKGGANIYHTQMRVLPAASVGSERVTRIATEFYASNELCKHAFCRQPETANFRILSLEMVRKCMTAADGGCSVGYETKGMKTVNLPALFWLEGSARQD